MRVPAPKPKQSGFTLVEVLISVVLATIAFVGIFGTYTTSLAIQRNVDERAKVMFLIQKTIEEALAVDYADLTLGTVVEIFEGEVYGLLAITNKVEAVTDSGIHLAWTRFTDPRPTEQMKRITIKADWGLEGVPTSQWESITFTSLRVERENTVDFSERTSSQLPWN
jgi:prepilin-type N-terminal cleavage/methylation domain-containing protein